MNIAMMYESKEDLIRQRVFPDFSIGEVSKFSKKNVSVVISICDIKTKETPSRDFEEGNKNEDGNNMIDLLKQLLTM